MSCYHPLKAYARMREDGKRDIVFVDNNDLPSYSRDGHLFYEKLLVPCGQCIGCRLEYSRQWAIRCVLEAKQWKNNYFLTLTYDDEHLPITNTAVCDLNGEFVGEFENFSLFPDHLTKFMKDLRRQLEYHYNWQGVRFYACGEYGSKTQRPHYHLILFNMPDLKDLTLYKTNFQGDHLYNSDFIDKIWNKGYSVLANVSFDTCAYVARYMLKKHKGKDSDFYDRNGILPEFSRCSRRPGIAFSYFDREKSRIYSLDEIIITDGKGQAKRVRPPQYYDRLYDICDPDDLKAVKLKRKATAEASMKKQLENTSLSADCYLALKEGNKLKQIERLTRSIEI